MDYGSWAQNYLPVTGRVPTYLVALFFATLPELIEHFSRDQETEDLRMHNRSPNFLDKHVEVFDYIIIGAGSGGAVVANRLSHDGRHTVLVLERGGDPNPFTFVPGLFSKVNYPPSTNYGYRIEKQPGACLANDQQACTFVRGRGLGGTSNVNAMNYVRGNRRDYDLWADYTGDPVWSYESVVPFFKLSEDYHGNYGLNRTYHSRGGEFYIGPQVPDTALDYILRAFREMRLKEHDYNAEQREGFGRLEVNVKEGKRWGTYQAFLEPILKRINLSIYRYARVLKLHFEEDTMRATGVTYIRHGQTRFVQARKEIILCAGSIDSPRILMQSGIGPRHHLESIGAEKVLIDLPVGEGLEDHIGVNVVFSINRTLNFSPYRDLTYDRLRNYLKSGSGEFGRVFYSSTGIAYISSLQTNDAGWPDLEFTCSGAVDDMAPYQNIMNCIVWLMRPRSIGYMKLRSLDPYTRPIIDPKYFTHPDDLSRILQGIDFILQIFDTEALMPLKPELFPNMPISGCMSVPFRSTAYWECYARQMTQTLCHPTGTCRMGSGPQDPRAVVDSRLRVLHTQGLRVVDSSVIPIIPTGHTNAITIMIAEMASTFILNDDMDRHYPEFK